MTEKRYKVHNENFGISFTNGKLLTWGESLVKAWPKGLEEECEELDCFGDVRCAVSVNHSDRTLGKKTRTIFLSLLTKKAQKNFSKLESEIGHFSIFSLTFFIL